MTKAVGVVPDLWLIAIAPDGKLQQDTLERLGRMPSQPFGLRIGRRGEHDVIVHRYGGLLCIEAATKAQAGVYVNAMGNRNMHCVAAIRHHGTIGENVHQTVSPDDEIEVVSGGMGTLTNGTSSFVISPTMTTTHRTWQKVLAGQDPTETAVPALTAEDLPLAIALGLITIAQ